MLCEQLENKRLLVRSCLTKFNLLQKMKTESAVELRKIVNSVSTTVSTLESIGRPISSSEDLFVFSVVELLDSRTRREWENTISDSPNPPSSSNSNGSWIVAFKRWMQSNLQNKNRPRAKHRRVESEPLVLITFKSGSRSPQNVTFAKRTTR